MVVQEPGRTIVTIMAILAWMVLALFLWGFIFQRWALILMVIPITLLIPILWVWALYEDEMPPKNKGWW